MLDILSNKKIEVYIEGNLKELLDDYSHLENAVLTIETEDQLMCLQVSEGRLLNIYNSDSKVNYTIAKNHCISRRERKTLERIMEGFVESKIRENIQNYLPQLNTYIEEAFEVKFTNDLLVLDQSIRKNYAKVYANEALNEFYNYNYDGEYIESLCNTLQDLLFKNSLDFDSVLSVEFLKEVGIDSTVDCTIAELANENEKVIIELLSNYAMWSYNENKDTDDYDTPPKVEDGVYLINHRELSKFNSSEFTEVYCQFNGYQNILKLISELDNVKDEILPLYSKYLSELEIFEDEKLEVAMGELWSDDAPTVTPDNTNLNKIFEKINSLEREYSDKVVKLNKLFYSLLYLVEDEVDINTLNVIRDLKNFIGLLRNIQYLSLN